MLNPEALAVLGGAIALAGGLMGSAIGIAIAASAGLATLSEDKGQFKNVILLASLPMTQTFYGLIVLILIVGKVGALAGTGAAVGTGAGYAILGIGIMAGLAQLVSAIYQGHVCASGISLLPKTGGRLLTNSIMFAVFVELIALLGLVFAIMAFSLIGV